LPTLPLAKKKKPYIEAMDWDALFLFEKRKEKRKERGGDLGEKKKEDKGEKKEDENDLEI
jgi:hypothetical protein